MCRARKGPGVTAGAFLNTNLLLLPGYFLILTVAVEEALPAPLELTEILRADLPLDFLLVLILSLAVLLLPPAIVPRVEQPIFFEILPQTLPRQ
jgi:hypothetical protein